MLIAEEYRSPVWRYGFYILLALTVLLYGLFWYQSDPVWGNSLRLASFICFAGAVFLGLRLREGSYTLHLIRTEQQVSILWFKGDRKLEEERLDTTRLHSIEAAVAERTFTVIPEPELVYVLGRQDGDSDEKIHLFHFGGRAMKFEPGTGDRIIEFLKADTADEDQSIPT